MELKHCRSCGCKKLDSILDLGKQPWCNDFTKDGRSCKTYPLHMVQCRECELLQLNYTVPRETMFSHHKYLSGSSKPLLEHFDRIAEENAQQFDLDKTSLIVDIGGNDGSQLMSYQKLGYKNVVNVESATNIASISTENGVESINDFFNEESARGYFGKGEAGLINAAGVFFHLEELQSVIRGIKYLLSRDGVFIAQCMYAGSMVDQLNFDTIYHEHLCYYTLKTLEGLLSPHGLKVFDAYISPIHSGSLIVKICHRKSSFRESGRLFETREADKRYTPSEFRRFADIIRKNKGEVKKFLKNLKPASIYAYGAPAKGNTLLNYYGLNSSLIEKAVEVNELKVGCRTPGTNIPITQESKEDIPDYYFLLSHNLVEDILERNKDLRKEGLKFIVPFPEATVV